MGADDAELTARIKTEIAAFSGACGLFARDLRSGEEIAIRADQVMPTASTIKVGILAELYRQAEAALVRMDDRVVLTADDWAPGSGVLKECEPGLAPTLTDLARLMIVVSDNVATEALVRLLGKERINASLAESGLSETRLVWEHRRTGRSRDYALSTPREIGRLMELIATDAFLSPAACAAMRDHLGRQQYLDQIPRYLPYNPYTNDRQPLTVMAKSGFSPGIRVDAAIIVASDRSVVMATMTEGSAERSYYPEQEGAVLNGTLARLICDAWLGDLNLGSDRARLGATGYIPLSTRVTLGRSG